MKKEKELLRKQVELLAEQSKSATDSELARLSTAMCEVYKQLETDSLHRRVLLGIALFSVVGLDLLISIIVLIEKLFGG